MTKATTKKSTATSKTKASVKISEVTAEVAETIAPSHDEKSIQDLSPLTARQEEIFLFIKSQVNQHRLPPTVREIGLQFGITSTNGVRAILASLIKKGYLKRAPKLSRGLELTENEDNTIPSTEENKNQVKPQLKLVENQSIEIPIIGHVAAGTPIMAVQNLQGTVTVDKDFLMGQKDVFALRVRGDSMIEAGIFDGDLVFARQQIIAERGQMIVAQVNDEATVKYFYPENNRIRLEPANKDYRPIFVEPNKEFSIAGRVIGVMRQIN